MLQLVFCYMRWEVSCVTKTVAHIWPLLCVFLLCHMSKLHLPGVRAEAGNSVSIGVADVDNGSFLQLDAERAVFVLHWPSEKWAGWSGDRSRESSGASWSGSKGRREEGTVQEDRSTDRRGNVCCPCTQAQSQFIALWLRKDRRAGSQKGASGRII